MKKSDFFDRGELRNDTVVNHRPLARKVKAQIFCNLIINCCKKHLTLF